VLVFDHMLLHRLCRCRRITQMLVSEIPVVNTFLPQGDRPFCSGRAQRREAPQISTINKRFSQIICVVCGYILLNSLRFEQGEKRSSRGAYFDTDLHGFALLRRRRSIRHPAGFFAPLRTASVKSVVVFLFLCDLFQPSQPLRRSRRVLCG
jgi:hypothetical protein